MHHKTKESAVKKYSHLSSKTTDLLDALKADDNKYSDEDITELMDAIIPKGATQEKITDPVSIAPFDLSEFNYDNFKSDPAVWKKYHELFAKLKWDDKYYFEEYDCTSLKKERYPGMHGSPKDVVGIKLNKTSPLKTTLIKVKDAIKLNNQIETDWAVQGHGRYYLLKK